MEIFNAHASTHIEKEKEREKKRSITRTLISAFKISRRCLRAVCVAVYLPKIARLHLYFRESPHNAKPPTSARSIRAVLEPPDSHPEEELARRAKQTAKQNGNCTLSFCHGALTSRTRIAFGLSCVSSLRKLKIKRRYVWHRSATPCRVSRIIAPQDYINAYLETTFAHRYDDNRTMTFICVYACLYIYIYIYIYIYFFFYIYTYI